MLVLTVILTVALALAMTGSAVGTLTLAAPVKTSLTEVRFPLSRAPALAALSLVVLVLRAAAA